MSVQFEWQAGSDDGQWETITRTGRGPGRRWLRRVPWWAWAVVALGFAGLGTLGYATLRRRYEELQRQAAFQIQSVIDLEARAFTRGDADLFLDQQDRVAVAWYRQQVRRIREGCSVPLDGEGAARDPCTPVLPAKVQTVDLNGDVAWVEVVEGRPFVRQVRFYRQTDWGWKHTAPRESFWGEEVTLRADQFVARYRARDEPHVRPYLERIQEITENVCGALECLPRSTLEVDFTVDTPVFDTPYLLSEQRHRGSDKLLLSSPWLSGIPVDGGAPDAQLDRLTHWTTYAIAARAVRASTEQDLNHFQEAVLQEYASWYSSQDPSQAPILGRIIERHGIEALPEVLRSVGTSRTLTALMARWLSLAASDSQLAYFQTLLNIEREALIAGRWETFMLLQHQGYPWWMSDQDMLFERWRQGGQASRSPVIRVRRVERIDGRARVALQGPSRSLEGYPPAAKSVVYFEYVDGDWKHATPFTAAVFWAFLPERRPAGTVTPPRTPTPAPNS
jgi:hypothetical protein